MPAGTAQKHRELAATEVRRRCDPEALFLPLPSSCPLDEGTLGQDRAMSALAFGVAIGERGFNIYVAGPPGIGKMTAVRRLLDRLVAERPAPDDWCYVHNFDDPVRPHALRLPSGQGRRLREGVRNLIAAARREIPRVFESEEYISGYETIMGDLNRRREEGMVSLSGRAKSHGFMVQMTPMGIGLVPMVNGQPLAEDAFAQLPLELRASIDLSRAQVSADVRTFLKQMRAIERETRERLEAQDREVALHAVGGLVEDLADDYADQPEISAYLERIREGILADIALFRGHPLPAGGRPAPGEGSDPSQALQERAFRKYEVNVVVDHGNTSGAPVVIESNPTYPNLIGRVEREAVFGALLTDLTLIRPGALHRANGGYLVVRIEDVMRAPLAWTALERSLRESTVAIEEAGEALGLNTARSLQPDPIPLDVKVLLVGDSTTYYLLHALDPAFSQLFKVRADFDTVIDRTPDNEHALAAQVAGWIRPQGQPPDPAALALLIEEASRLAADQRKLAVHVERLFELVREAEHWASVDGAGTMRSEHVRRAVEQHIYRSALVQERLREMIVRGVLLVRPEGRAIGQVHGLAVISAGDVPFGQPSRITATVGVGRDGVLDIERQAELGGRIHSKGMLILGGYLSDTYARDKPLALTARLVFEQTYEGVEGDSASLAELLALLSRLADLPLNQAIAVTGSVNQRGEVQAVGGVNEKIEGFFDTCQALRLSGDQGVILPASNIDNLMLREDVAAAVAVGAFHIYPVRSVDEALEILTGEPSGSRGADGRFRTETVHHRVDERLRALAETLRGFDDTPKSRQNGHAGRAHAK
jgi:lon-related putative ATP-dependent protease